MGKKPQWRKQPRRDSDDPIMRVAFRSRCPRGHVVEETTLEGRLVELVEEEFAGRSPSVTRCSQCDGKLGDWRVVTFLDDKEIEELTPEEFVAKYDALGRAPGPEHN